MQIRLCSSSVQSPRMASRLPQKSKCFQWAHKTPCVLPPANSLPFLLPAAPWPSHCCLVAWSCFHLRSFIPWTLGPGDSSSQDPHVYTSSHSLPHGISKCHSLSEDFPEYHSSKMEIYHQLQTSLPLACFIFLLVAYHLLMCNLLVCFFSSSKKCKLLKRRDFYLFCSLLIPTLRIVFDIQQVLSDSSLSEF